MIFMNTMATVLTTILLTYNQPTYQVISQHGNYQLRNYDDWIVAQTTVYSNNHQWASSRAFNLLGRYIFGNNERNISIQMTSPVTSNQVGNNLYKVQFYMPSNWTLDTLPKPNDPRVELKKIPSRKLFVHNYRGGWSSQTFQKKHAELLQKAKDLSIDLDLSTKPIWARYDSPSTRISSRTNQVMYLVK